MKIKKKELSQSVIDNIDIVQTISQYCPTSKLQENPSIYSCHCPFNPLCGEALLIHQTYKHFFCFGCSTSGDVISFVAKIGGMKLDTAARFLANINKIETIDNTHIKNITPCEDTKEIYE